MNIFNSRVLKEKVTVWKKDGLDMFGNAQFAEPIQIYSRWENRTNQSFSQTTNDNIVSHTVFTNTELSVGDYIYRGISTSMKPISDAYEIKSFYKTSNLAGTKVELVAIL